MAQGKKQFCNKIYIGADHGGYKLKEEIKKYLQSQKIDFADMGNVVNDPNDNFPDFAYMVCGEVLKDKKSFGILICGTGIGISIAANHIKGIRAALCHNPEYAEMARRHNDANILCLGGRFLDKDTAFNIVTAFINTEIDPNPKYKNRMNTADGSYENKITYSPNRVQAAETVGG
jgi:ribose 5-phosphate isomerase B